MQKGIECLAKLVLALRQRPLPSRPGGTGSWESSTTRHITDVVVFLGGRERIQHDNINMESGGRATIRVYIPWGKVHGPVRFTNIARGSHRRRPEKQCIERWTAL